MKMDLVSFQLFFQKGSSSFSVKLDKKDFFCLFSGDRYHQGNKKWM